MRMDLISPGIENATHDAANRTISPTDYQSTELYTINSTDNSDKAKNWAMLGVLPIVAFVAAGNILVILAVKLDHKLRSSTNYFLTSLAVADLLVAITVMPPSLVMIINNYVWPFPESLCGIWVMLDVCFSTSSILHLCTISLDRYWALAQPFRHRSNGWASKSPSAGGRITQKKWRSGSGLINSSKMTKRVTRRIILVWGISLGISLPLPIMGHQKRSYIFMDQPSGGSTCVINIPEFTIYGSLVAFFLPLIVMFVTYSLTIRTLQKQSKMVKLIMGNEGSVSHMIRPSRSSSLTSGQSFKRTRSSVISIRDGYNRQASTGTYEAMPSLPDIVCTSTETKPLADCNANTSQKEIATSNDNYLFHRPLLPRSISDTTTQKFESGSIAIKDTRNNTLRKSESDASDTSNMSNQPSSFGRSPMLARANFKLSKVVSKFPLSRVSTRRISASARSRVIATEQRASKVLGLIFTLFCLFWCPFFITNAFSGVCIRYNMECDLNLMGNLMNWFVWVGYVSSGVNPCVYTLFSRQFRETFKELICFRCSEIPHHHHRRRFRTHNFDCGTAGSSTSSFHRDYSYRKYETSRNIGTQENGNRFGTTQTEGGEFKSSSLHLSGHTKGAHEKTEYRDNDKDRDTQEQYSSGSHWRSTWHSTHHGNALNALKWTASTRIRSGSKVTFRDTLLQPHRKRKPLLYESDHSSSEKLGDIKARNSETL